MRCSTCCRARWCSQIPRPARCCASNRANAPSSTRTPGRHAFAHGTQPLHVLELLRRRRRPAPLARRALPPVPRGLALCGRRDPGPARRTPPRAEERCARIATRRQYLSGATSAFSRRYFRHRRRLTVHSLEDQPGRGRSRARFTAATNPGFLSGRMWVRAWHAGESVRLRARGRRTHASCPQAADTVLATPDARDCRGHRGIAPRFPTCRRRSLGFRPQESWQVSVDAGGLEVRLTSDADRVLGRERYLRRAGRLRRRRGRATARAGGGSSSSHTRGSDREPDHISSRPSATTAASQLVQQVAEPRRARCEWAALCAGAPRVSIASRACFGPNIVLYCSMMMMKKFQRTTGLHRPMASGFAFFVHDRADLLGPLRSSLD